MKIRTEKVIDVSDWDQLVEKTYGRPYNLQQQEGCMLRENIGITVPSSEEDYGSEMVPEIVNHEDMGVSFSAWLARDPKQPIKDQEHDWELSMWWERNFYPNVQMVANDLHAKGLLEAEEYTIDIDW